MTKPGDDPRMRPATKSPADKDDGFGFSGFGFGLRKPKSDDFFEESEEFYEAAFKVAEAAEQAYEDDMDAEMWRVSDEAERKSKERHPSSSLLLFSSPPLLTITLTLTSPLRLSRWIARHCARPPSRRSREISTKPRRTTPTRWRQESVLECRSLTMAQESAFRSRCYDSDYRALEE